MVLFMALLAGLSESYDFDLDDMKNLPIGTLKGIKGIVELGEELLALVGEEAFLQTMDAITAFTPEPPEWQVLIKLGCRGQGDVFHALGNWWWNFSRTSLSRSVLEEIHKQFQANILVKYYGPSTSYISITVPEFQRQIQSRIATHAIRVATTRLGAAALVQQGIEDAMASVWASLPEGFGPMGMDGSDDSTSCSAGEATVGDEKSSGKDNREV
ncbi:hypothetical protein FRC07_010693, partial [Ceratobasidium sp. 392]